jgi:predicted lipoprotein with Yx(FWY)xxD motif
VRQRAYRRKKKTEIPHVEVDQMSIRRLVLASLALLSVGAASMFGSDPARGAVSTVTVGTGTVDGKPTKILADAKGFALYWLSSDKAGTSACTGGCTATWRPLLSTGRPTASTSLPGKLTVIHTAHGAQVAYNGHLLYRYAGDAKPGQVNGDDQKGPAGGEWYVVTPFKTASTAPAPSAVLYAGSLAGSPTGLAFTVTPAARPLWTPWRT